MIQLIDRRFVAFFFNRSGVGEGFDRAASDFVGKQTKNPYAYFAAFTPDGKIVGESDLYADKEAVMAWLVQLLADHPKYAGASANETAVLAQGGLAAARLSEELAHYDDAVRRYDALLAGTDAAAQAAALSGLLRIARYRGDWAAHEAAEQRLRAGAAGDMARLVDADVEQGYRLLAQKEWARARVLLQPLTRRANPSSRLAEAHFAAGRACWFAEDPDWALFHWCWIVDHMPEDRLYMRARIAAAAFGMPYPNSELGDWKPEVGNIGTQHIVAAVDRAIQTYRSLLPAFERGDFTARKPAVAVAPLDDVPDTARSDEPADVGAMRSPMLLVARLRDGNEHVPANNLVVRRLEQLGRPAIAPLITAIADEHFPGRGYAAWALSQVLKANGFDDAAALAALQQARRDRNSYVATLARSGLSTLPAK
ncbi:MAG: hypothetical protein MUC36_21620 [Planctomycetes bacterium]|nr:hypothetical protein [Planctomycetota bacterium]